MDILIITQAKKGQLAHDQSNSAKLYYNYVY